MRGPARRRTCTPTWTVADGELLYVVGEWTAEERELLIICEQELLASTWGLVALATWMRRSVVSWKDNTVAGGDVLYGAAEAILFEGRVGGYICEFCPL